MTTKKTMRITDSNPGEKIFFALEVQLATHSTICAHIESADKKHDIDSDGFFGENFLNISR